MEPKPGIKTTEFWLTLATTLLAFLVGTGAVPSDLPHVEIGAFLTSGAAIIAYIIGRMKVKSGGG